MLTRCTERRGSPSRLRRATLGASVAAMLLAGCGSDARDEEPALLKPGTLKVSVVAAQPDGEAGPAGFQRELISDLAQRLELRAVFFDEPVAGPATAAVLARRTDVAAPVAIAEPDTGALDYSAPYFEDDAMQTLYGLAVVRGRNPEQKTALLEDLDEALSEMKDDGTLQKIYDKWLPGTDVPDRVLNDATN